MEEQLELPFPWHPNVGFKDSVFTYCQNCARYRWFHTFTNDIQFRLLCDVCHADEKTGVVVSGEVTNVRL